MLANRKRYKSIENVFLTKTSSRDYLMGLFYVVFAVLLFYIWQLTDFLLKAYVDGEMDYAPDLTVGECVEIIASALILPDRAADSPPVRRSGVAMPSRSTNIREISPARSIISFK